MQPELLTTREEWQRHASEQPATTVSLSSSLLISKLGFPVPALLKSLMDSRPLMATKSFKPCWEIALAAKAICSTAVGCSSPA